MASIVPWHHVTAQTNSFKCAEMPMLGLPDNSRWPYFVYILQCAENCYYVGVQSKGIGNGVFPVPIFDFSIELQCLGSCMKPKQTTNTLSEQAEKRSLPPVGPAAPPIILN